MLEHSTSHIQSLEDLGLSRQDAIDCLKACNNDVDKAAEYFWSGDLEKNRKANTWDEGVFHTDRYDNSLEPLTGWPNVNNPPHYSIQGPDVLPSDAMGPRPSSPMNPGMSADTNRQSDDLRRAIELSLSDNYNTNDYDKVWGPQESGITGAHSTPTYFGPATRPEYDPTHWALTIPATHEIYLDPVNPNARRRKEGEPAFFKPSSDGYHLGPALAIYHSIPIARESLLVRHKLLNDYGYNERWWSGEAIEAPRITNLFEGDGLDTIQEIEPSEVVAEVQRLMAFLGHTLRGYGSVDGLAKMRNVSEKLQGAQLSTFFKAWVVDVGFLSDTAHRPFTSAVNIHSPDQDQQEIERTEFQVLEINLPEELSNGTLYNALDFIIWPQIYEGPRDFVLEHVSDVFTISVKKENTNSGMKGVGIDIPAELYMDRYTKQFMPFVAEMKKNREAVNDEIKRLGEREERLKSCRVGKVTVDPTQADTTKLLETAIEHFEYLKLPSYRASDAAEVLDTSGDVDMDTDKPGSLSKMSSMLKRILDKLKGRLEELAQKRETLQKALKELSTAFTSPETIPSNSPPLRRHSLRGVFTDLSTTFIKVPNPKPADGEVAEQWWCLSYPLRWEADPNAAAFKVLKVTEKEVLEAAKYTGDGILLLVYATDEALKPVDIGEASPLPEPLINFVARDNQTFLDEIQEFSDANNTNNDPTTNSSNDRGKRKRFAPSSSTSYPHSSSDPNPEHTWRRTGTTPPPPPLFIENADLMIGEVEGGLHQPPASPNDEDDRPLMVMDSEQGTEESGGDLFGTESGDGSRTASEAGGGSPSSSTTVGRPQKKSSAIGGPLGGRERSTTPGRGEGGVGLSAASEEWHEGGGGRGEGKGRSGWQRLQDYGQRGVDVLPPYSTGESEERRYDGNFVTTWPVSGSNTAAGSSGSSTTAEVTTYTPQSSTSVSFSPGNGSRKDEDHEMKDVGTRPLSPGIGTKVPPPSAAGAGVAVPRPPSVGAEVKRKKVRESLE